MWWPFKRKNKHQRKLLKELGDVSEAFAIVEKFNRCGLIHWQAKDKVLLIEESLATIALAQGEKGFRRFLEHTAQWQNFQLLTEAYEQQRIDIEAQAVRDANNKLGKILTPADIQRIRQQARNEMIMIDPHKLKNLIREFDIMIIRADAQSGEQTTQENGQLLAIGHYDGKKLEMAMYDDVKDMLFQEK